MHSRRSSSSLVLSGSGSYDETYKTSSTAIGENNTVDHSRITMKTRVAVRDHTPHRFQVVPLRDVGQLLVARKDVASQLVLPSTPSNSILKPPSGRPGPSNIQTMTSLPSFHSVHGLNVNPLSKDSFMSIKPPGKGPQKINTTVRRRENDRTHSVGDTRPVLVEVDLNSTPNQRSVKSDNLSHLSLRTNRRFVTIQQHLPCKADPPCTPSELGSRDVSSELDLQSSGHNQSPQCTLDDGFCASHSFTKDSNLETDARTNLVKKVTFELGHRTSLDSDLDEPRSKKRHAIYTQSLFVPYCHDVGYPNRPSVDNSVSENSSSAVHIPASHDQGPPLLFRDESCDPLKTGDWLAFLDDSNEAKGLDISGKGLLGEPFELKPPQGKEEGIATAPTPCLGSAPVAPLKLVARLLKETAYDGKLFDEGKVKDEIIYSGIVMELFADIDKAIQGWR
ncbi:hypothetical protein BJ165DRAFT_74332 [Panaeolus papilionaceus]|nr:hypothetical protein BJ165DRAFT_74332 [Panaeolus papilionaceus]